MGLFTTHTTHATESLDRVIYRNVFELTATLSDILLVNFSRMHEKSIKLISLDDGVGCHGTFRRVRQPFPEPPFIHCHVNFSKKY